MNPIKNIYLSKGLKEFKLTSHTDLLNIHSIDIKKIPGYSDLSEEHRAVFDPFIINFFNGWGLEARAKLVPVSVNFVMGEEYLGKKDASDDYYITLGGKLTALYDGDRTKVLRRWKDKAYKHLPCIKTEQEKYLRFEYRHGKYKEWQHVISATQWY